MKLRNLLSLALAALLLLSSPSCRREEDAPSTPAHGAADDSLTFSPGDGERYASLVLPLPEGYSMPYGCPAVARDPDTGSLSAAAEKRDSTGAESVGRYVFTFSPDGDLLSQTEIPGDVRYFMEAAAFSGDSLWYTLAFYEDGVRSCRLCRLSLEDGSLLLDEDFLSLSQMPPDYVVTKMTADGDGDLWFTSNGMTLVYTPELRYVNTVRSGRWISSFARDPEGKIWACSNYGVNTDWGAARLDKGTGGYGDVVSLDHWTRNIVFSADGVLYFDTPEGVSRLPRTEDGWGEPEAVLSFLASGIAWSDAGSLTGDEHSDLLMALEGEFLFCASAVEGRWTVQRPVLWRPAGEEEPEEVVTLQMAFTHELPANIRAEIVRFNREHPGIQVTTLDYSIYNNDTVYDSGAQRLMIDMLNGIAAPDIVYGDADSTELITLAEKRMTADLMPYLLTDERVNPDNVFGCVLRYFDDGAGGLWGIAPYFSLLTWIAGPDTLGSFGGDDGWTLEDFFNFADSLPEGRFLSSSARRGFFPLPTADEQFVDRESGTCSFDSPLYVRYLRFLDSLPSQEEFAKIARRDPRLNYLDGSVALARGYLEGDSNVLEWESWFNSPDYVIVGYPSADPAWRNQLSAEHAFVVTKTAEHPDAAWTFLRTYFRSPGEQTWMFGIGLSSLKSCFDEQVEKMKNEIMIHFENGEWTGWPAPREEYEKWEEAITREMDRSGNGVPWAVEPVDEEQLGRIRAYLDSAEGRALDRLPSAVTNLIREEITAFLGGVGTAEECAGKIQSRVSLWLAENH